MINESKFRSPRWLRKFADIEINTGEDIKGNVSKKQLRKEEKEKKENLRKQWNKNWNNADSNLFKQFIRDSFPKDSYNTFSSEGMTKIYNKWLDDFEIWNKYEAWIIRKKREEDALREESERKEREHKKVELELLTLFKRITDDFNLHKYRDKFSTPMDNGETTFHYNFEGGDSVILNGNKIIYNFGSQRITYTVGLAFKNKFIILANQIINCKFFDKRTGQKSQRNNSEDPINRKSKPTHKYSHHPKGNLYQTLRDTVELRRSQLEKLSKSDPNREFLQNELLSAEKKLKKIQSDYKFENLINFINFK